MIRLSPKYFSKAWEMGWDNIPGGSRKKQTGAGREFGLGKAHRD